jgi:lipopolysaccharide/colanic/teichoic acid biosynthesis glycosyltransferase
MLSVAPRISATILAQKAGSRVDAETLCEQLRLVSIMRVELACYCKRLSDIIIAAILSLVLAPLIIMIVVAIKLETPGPVIFCQVRRGFHNKPFTLYKFRTMYSDQCDAEARIQTRVNDPRVTRVGSFIRRRSFDELPQLYNVVRGDMSLVGPRPHAVGTFINGIPLADLIQDYAARYDVRPGITGLAQVKGVRGELDTVEKANLRIQYDLDYITRWSLWLDVIILAKTFRCLLGDKRAY